MRTALIAITEQGWRTAEAIHAGLPGSVLCRYSSGVRNAIEQAWYENDAIICVMAAGIAVRCIASLCSSKFNDPCVIVTDETGAHIVSLLSGHIGGGNTLAHTVAEIVGGTAVVTTASDVTGHTAVDLWSIEQNCTIANPEKLAKTSGKLLNNGKLSVFQERPFMQSLPDDFKPCTNIRDADIVMSLSYPGPSEMLYLIPRIRYIGFGCRRGVGIDEFKRTLADLQMHQSLDLKSIAGIASIDIKADETGLLEVRQLYNWPISFFSKEQISSVEVSNRSDVVFEKIGVYSVSEATAILAAAKGNNPGKLIIEKKKWQNITAAVAEMVF